MDQGPAATQRREFAGRLAERQRLTIPAEDTDYEDLGRAFLAWTDARKGAILQPPKRDTVHRLPEPASSPAPPEPPEPPADREIELEQNLANP